MTELGSFALYLAVGAAWVALLAGPIGQAIARRISGSRTPPGTTTGEVTAEQFAVIEQRLSELESAQARVAELEERLDFAERLLARIGPPEERVDRLVPKEAP